MADFYVATISQSRFDVCLATISQPWLSFTLPPLANQDQLLHCHHSQTRLTFTLPPSVNQDQLLPCHLQSDTAHFFALPPVSRTPCPVVSNVLDIQHMHLRAIYIVHFSWMNIATTVRLINFEYCLYMQSHTQLNTLPCM